jgi:hypothetical protein
MAAEAELEIAVLRLEVTILRRQVKRPTYRASDMAFLAASSGAVALAEVISWPSNLLCLDLI